MKRIRSCKTFSHAFLCLFLLPAWLSAATSEEIARRWAPIHYQDTDDTSPIEDYLTTFTYDGNFSGTDNWDHLYSTIVVNGFPFHVYPGPYPYLASIYYAVAETCTHYFISYGFYHPHDWSDGYLPSGKTYDPYGNLVDEGQEHENDLEDAIVVVRKGAGAPDRLEAVLTQAHGGYYSWLPVGSSLSAAAGHTDHLGTIPQAEFPPGSGELRPQTAQCAKGHGLGAKDGMSDFAGESGTDGIIYYPTGVPGQPSSGNDRNATYSLEPLLGSGSLFKQQLSEDLLPVGNRVTYVRWGNFRMMTVAPAETASTSPA
jgi:hypothetical protein